MRDFNGPSIKINCYGYLYLFKKTSSAVETVRNDGLRQSAQNDG